MKNSLKKVVLLMTTVIAMLMLSSLCFAGTGTPGQVTGLKQTRGTSSSFTIQWEKPFNCDGCEIWYSDNSSFTNAATDRTSSNEDVYLGLNEGKSYYVKIRAYNYNYNSIFKTK